LQQLERPSIRRLHVAVSVLSVALACHPTTSEPPPAGVDSVAIDLTSTGLGAKIRAPERAAVETADQGQAVRVRGGDDFDMVVRRGALDLWELRCEIASARSPELLRFLENDPSILRYTIRTKPGKGFHFAAVGEAGGVLYSCRSVGEGARSEEALAVMIDACMSVKFVSEAEAKASSL